MLHLDSTSEKLDPCSGSGKIRVVLRLLFAAFLVSPGAIGFRAGAESEATSKIFVLNPRRQT